MEARQEAENGKAPVLNEESGALALSSISTSMVEIFGALSNPDVRERLERLEKKLEQLQNVEVAPRPTILRRSLRVGAVPEAIMRVLADSVEPMRMRDIHAEVEALVGLSVSRSAVKNWLANHVRGEQALLIRLGRGRYRLRT
jgi:hypothetical protein